jgi:alpha-beta hydrolase superfamily lysophospholipase
MRVLVLHGMFCTAWHTGPLVEGLRGAGLDARGLELPGRGTSRAGLAEHVDFVCAEAAAAGAGGEELALVGHSLGGLICLLAAARLAKRPWLHRLALLGAAPPAGSSAISVANTRFFLPLAFGGGSAQPPAARHAALFMNRQDETLRRSVHARLVPERRRLIRSVALPWLDSSGASRVRFADVPHFASLVVAGEGDRSTPPRLQRRTTARLPGARYACLQGPDHYGFLAGTGSEETLTLLTDFLQDRSERAEGAAPG